VNSLLLDLRHAIRQMLKAPVFTVVATLSLGLGIGANTAIFSLVNGVLLKPLPVRAPGEVVAVFTSDFSGPPYGGSSHPDYLDFREKCDAFAGLSAYTLQPVAILGEEGQSARLWAELVTGDYFATLGIPIARGRALAPEDDRPEAAAAVLSHDVWQRRFASDPDVLGRPLTLSGRTFTVVGVAAPGFAGLVRGLAADLWLPLSARPALNPDASPLSDRRSRAYRILGRLKPGVGLATAQSQLSVLASQLHKAYPDEWSDVRREPRRISVLPESAARVDPRMSGPLSAFSVLLMGVVGLVLLIACANIAGLVLARAAERGSEVAIRLSLGASRARIVRQFLTENLMLALLGGGAGWLLAVWATALVGSLRLPLPLPLRLEIMPDARVVGFALAVSLATGIVLGLVPGLQASRPDLLPALRHEARTGAAHRSRLRQVLVIAEVAFCLVLLVGGGLFLRSLRNATAIDPGFDPRNVLVLSADLSLAGYDATRAAAFQGELAERLRGVPGVEAAGLAAALPLDPHAQSRRRVYVPGYTEQPGEDMEVHLGVVGPGYFDALRIPILRGRGFGPADVAEAPGVVMVNEAFARRFWPGQDPIGRTMRAAGDDGPLLEVVGVAGDGKYGSLSEDPLPFFYEPFVQDFRFARRMGAFMPAAIAVRVGGDPLAHAATLRDAVQSLDPSLPVYGARTLEQHLGVALLPARVAGYALGFFGLLGLGLASLGLSGIVAYSVSQRTHEIGVRVALGASRSDVLRLVLAEGMRLTVIGLAVGLLLAFLAGRLVSGLLLGGLSAADPATFLAVGVLLVLMALVASYLPARRALRVDPMAALRRE
jgi:predicted permease